MENEKFSNFQKDICLFFFFVTHCWLDRFWSTTASNIYSAEQMLHEWDPILFA